ncbi:MAG: DNA N-6-adenine-methyltransferase, partial [Actinomycetota bacterium]
MSLVGFKGRNHPQQVASTGRDVDTDDRATTAEVFGPLDAEFGPFTIDVAAAAHNTKCSRYFDARRDGLAQSWSGEVVWCNPPYSAIEPWVRKAWHETHRGDCQRVVLLLPANRTE